MPLNNGCYDGPLNKWTNLIQGWQFRWFVLDQPNGLLAYYTSKENMHKGERRGCVRLRDGAHVGYDNDDDITFTITSQDKTFHLQARTLSERQKWVSKIEKTIRLHSASTSLLLPTGSYSTVAATAGTPSSSSKSKNKIEQQHAGRMMLLNGAATSGSSSSNSNNFLKVNPNSDYSRSNSESLSNDIIQSNYALTNGKPQSLAADLEQFDNCLAESDAYMQMLTEQLKELEKKKASLLNEKTLHLDSSDRSVNNESSSLSPTTSRLNGDRHHRSTSTLENVPGDSGDSPGSSNETKTSDDGGQIDRMSPIIDATENLIETLKHAIICLQIAKANCDPKISMESTYDLNDVLSNFSHSSTAAHPHSLKAKEYNPKSLENSLSGLEAEKLSIGISQIKEKEKSDVRQLETQISQSSKQNNYNRTRLPVESYSSSDDENNIMNDSHTTSNSHNNNEDDFKSYNEFDDDEDEDDDADDDQEFVGKNVNEDNDSESFYDAIDQNYSAQDPSKVVMYPEHHHSADLNMINQEVQIATHVGKNGVTTATLQSSETLLTTAIVATSPNENQTTMVLSQDNKIVQYSADKTTINTSSLSSSSELAVVTPTKSPSQASSSSFEQRILEEYELYDEDAPTEDIDINNQQSVITHLLTQVRIGMDLTKITLPTFILEPRSLLEMYADFFAHTDLFLQIPDIKNPRDRMVQVVKWYLSTFQAGRKSPVAKKPYNPILGEIFQCWYNVPGYQSGDQTPVSDGPIPWANKDQLTFIAEQVSHHPPISAFYAEHFNKRIQVDGYTWTKSKFLGLSIGVNMIGKAVLSLLDLDEEYVANFPSAYGRSILTVPWFEMGGEVTVSCAKTGYYANIEFLTKPFYGGKKHQIQGTIFGPDKKPLYTLDGDWNGTMFIKSGSKKDILISTQSIPKIKKQLRPLNEQDDYESRKLWREVTYYLRTKQIDLATEGKQKLEQRQREELKQRKETNTQYKTKYFQEQGENWIYEKPLIYRLQQQQQQQQGK